MRIEGSVSDPAEFGYADLAGLNPQVSDVGTVVPGREGVAVPLSAVLDEVGVSAEADYITVVADDGEFSASVPLAAVQEAVLVYRLGDEPLPRAKGGPVRLLIPESARCGFDEVDACANVKFVALLRLHQGAGQDTRPTSPTEHKDLHKKPGHEHSH